MQIKINNGNFGYGGETLFENLNLEINPKEKIAIIGRNGSGKTTLLKIISGEIELHQNENSPQVFEKIGNPKIGTLKQMTFDDESITLESEVLKCFDEVISLEEKLSKLQTLIEAEPSEKLAIQFSKLHDEFERLGGYQYHAEVDEVLSNFGLFNEKTKKLSEFSGGQKTKISFIKLILSKPDILLLDEPTNHLDIKSVGWFENYIKKYKNSVVIVSHDREFLDNTVGVVYELEHKKLTRYVGNYSKFLQIKQQNYDSLLKAYEAQQRKIADINAFIERFRYKSSKAPAVQSRIKMLEKMEIIVKPEKADNRSFLTKIKPNVESGSEVLSCVNLKIGYEKEHPLATVNLKVERGDRLGIIGGNGLGKSTLLKVLMEKIPPLSGHFKFGYNTQIGYFEQIESKLYSKKTILENFSETFPNLSVSEVRNCLGAFLFSGSDVSKSLNSLSGGEIVRLELCKLLQSKPNVLILDEPTNHMDIASKESLENLLLNYTGTIIFVSHDRYFTKKIATKLLVFENNEAKFFDGTYSQFFDPFSKPQLETQPNRIPEIKKEKIEYPIDYGEEPQNPYIGLSPYLLSKEKGKLENKLEKIELSSKNNEEKLKKLSADFVADENGGDFKKLMEIQAEIESTQINIDKLASEWVEISQNLILLNEVLDENKQN